MKLKNITNIKWKLRSLKELTKQRVQFINYDEEELYLLDRISSCSDPETCNDYAYCETKGGICALRIPKYHLISGRDNELIYLARVADELLRYDNIRDYLLSYSTLLSLGQNNYKLNKTEIIIPESVLFTTYFDNVTIKPINPYVRHSIYNTTFPSKSSCVKLLPNSVVYVPSLLTIWGMCVWLLRPWQFTLYAIA